MQVILIAVLSLDGRLTLPDKPGPGFASTEDQAWFQHALQEFDCAVMGRPTFEQAQDQILVSSRRSFLRMVLTRTPESFAALARPDALEFVSATPGEVVGTLRQRRRNRCALLGGGHIYREFLAAGLVDAMWLTLEPVVLGGGTPLAAGGPVQDGRFRLGEMRLLGPDTLLLNYQKPGAPLVSLPFG